MTAEQVVAVAGLIADRSRAAMCLALLDGRSWTVTELARHAGIAPSTASEHVVRLRDGGLVVVESQGRHRYVRLASARTAQLLEDLGGLPPQVSAPRPRRTLRAVSQANAMARARTCYDHLAGRLGVGIADGMTAAGLLDTGAGFALTASGLRWLETKLDIDVATMSASRRPLVRSCLDWTERRPHIGGAAGAAICTEFFARGWISRIGTERAVLVSPAGGGALRQLCGVDVAAVA